MSEYNPYSVKWCIHYLGISSTSLLEIKKRLGIKKIDNQSFLEIEKVVADINSKYEKVTPNTIIWYWGRYMQ